jgi:tetratricopeptide (TPR) repeat protein
VETLAQMIDVLMGHTAVVAAFETISEEIAEDPGKALAALAALPKKAQESKPLQLLKIQAASAVDDASYEAAIAGYEKLFPGDPSLNLVSIDGFIVRKNFSEALKVVDRLDESLGGDPYLDELRVSLLLQNGKDLDRATEIAEKSLAAQPESEDAHYLLLGAHVANRNFAGAVAIMRLMGERFDLVFEEEGLDPGDANYMALKASPEWAAYSAKLSDDSE